MASALASGSGGGEGKDGYDYLIKIIVVGNSGVGKSSLIHRFSQGGFNPHFVSTVGVDFALKTVDVNGKRVKMQIWDCAGNERFRSITTSYYRGAHAVMLVFDVNDQSSIDAIPSWIKEVQTHTNIHNNNGSNLAGGGSKLILIGNKHDGAVWDKPAKPFGLPDELQDMAQELGASVVLTSAKHNSRVDEAFHTIASNFIADRHLYPPQNNKTPPIVVCRLDPPPTTSTFSSITCCS